jgi:hypothetical protein
MHEKSETHVSSMNKRDNLVMVSHEKKLDINRFISKAKNIIEFRQSTKNLRFPSCFLSSLSKLV